MCVSDVMCQAHCSTLQHTAMHIRSIIYESHMTWLIHTCDVTHSHVWCGTIFLSALSWYESHMTWLIHTCDVTHSHVWCGMIFTSALSWYESHMTWLIHTCDVTHSYAIHTAYPLYHDINCRWHGIEYRVAEYHLFYRAILQKRPIILWSLLAVATPYELQMTWDTVYSVNWLIHTCGVTRSHVWCDSFILATWRIHMCDMTDWHVRHDSFICVTWLIHRCDMSHSYEWHVSFICAKWLIHMCDMTHSYVWHDSFICETWLIHMCT